MSQTTQQPQPVALGIHPNPQPKKREIKINNSPDFDKTTVDYVSRPANEAWEQAEALARDNRYSLEHKHATIRELFADATTRINERYEEQLNSLDAEEPTLRAKARARFSPQPEDAAALLYTRDALRERIRAMPDHDVRGMWEAAIEDGDTITARVLADFLPSMRWKRTGRSGNELSQPPKWVDELRAKTEDLFLSDEAKKARARLNRNEATIYQMNRAKHLASAKVRAGFQINRDGTLTDGGRAEQSRQFRNSW